jgi:hypothetical protein
MRYFNSGRSVLTVTIEVQMSNGACPFDSADGSVLTEGVVAITPYSNANLSESITARHLNLDTPYGTLRLHLKTGQLIQLHR